MKLLSKSDFDTQKIAQILGGFLKAGDTVLLYGALGAGKSVFARGCASALGVSENMASPSFTIMQPYAGDNCPVYHFDLYRLSGADELYFSGLEEKIASDGVALIEWPQQADISVARRAEVDIDKTDNPDKRIIEMQLFDMDDVSHKIYGALKPYEIGDAI